MESKERPEEFQIDIIAKDSPPLKNQAEWKMLRKKAITQYGQASIYNLVPEEGKVGIAPAIYALTRGGIFTIDKFTRTPIDGIYQTVKNKFGRVPEQDILDKIDLLQEKALEFTRRHPILLSRN